MKLNSLYDGVVVVGGGPAGFGAALAAARNGAKVLLLERSGCAGGMSANGMLGFYGPLDSAERNQSDWTRFRLDREGRPYPPALGIGQRVIGGIPEEFLEALAAEGMANIPKFGYIETNIERVKSLMEETLLKAGVEISYHSQLCGADRLPDGSFKLQVAFKEGLRELKAKLAVDASGDGDLASFLGAECVQGRASDGKCQGVTLVFRLGNVKTDPLDFLPDSQVAKTARAEAQIAYGKGEISFNPGGVGCVSPIPGMPGVFMVNQQHCFDIDGTKSADLSKALIEGRRQVRELAGFYRRHVPGCEDCFLLDTAPSLGVRETRRVMGDYVMTGSDILGGTKFEDAISRHSYFMDMHLKGENCEGGALKPGDWYEIPYRCLLPKDVDGLLTAGRCISGTHEALSSYRLMSSCMAIGQAAGTAAAMAFREKLPPRKINPKELRVALLKDGAVL